MSQTAAPKGDRWAEFRGLRWWQLVLSLLPLALIALGGLVGGAIGAVAVLVNLKIARSALPPALGALLMILVVGAAYLVCLIIRIAVSSLLA